MFATSIGGVLFGEHLWGKDAGLAESNGSLPPRDDFKKSPVGWLPVYWDQLWAQHLVTTPTEWKAELN